MSKVMRAIGIALFLCSFFVSRRLNPLLAQEEQISLCEIGFASQTRRLNPLLAQRGSDLLRKQGGFDMYDVAIIGAGVVGSAICKRTFQISGKCLCH